MRKELILLLLVAGVAVCAQPPHVPDTQFPSSPIPSDEAFINQVVHTVVDSAAGQYYLCDQAGPCSFVQYDYDEWIMYDLQETVPIYTLNELAKNSYFDRKSCTWQQDQLVNASCISQEMSISLLDPVHGLQSDTTKLSARQKRIIARKWVAWSRLPVAAHTVYYFSRPVFTDDGQYAILDMDYHCDARQCGQGAICLFRQTASGWILIGKRVRWGG
jgi:hypothetical protein